MKNTLKKVLFSLGAIGLVGAGTVGMVNAQNSTNTFGQPNTEGQNQIDVVGGGDGSNYSNTGLITTIKTFINRVLGMLSLIALVICLRGGFQMLTASGDETKYKKGFTILKQAALGLAIVGLSWLFVTLILWLINNNARAN